MARIEDIQQRWREHEAASFPKGLRGRSVGGVDLTLLESNIARFIMSAIELKGPLPNRSRPSCTTSSRSNWPERRHSVPRGENSPRDITASSACPGWVLALAALKSAWPSRLRPTVGVSISPA